MSSAACCGRPSCSRHASAWRAASCRTRSSRRSRIAAVDRALALQEEAGLDVVTDGEMRRLSFQSQLPAAVDGFADWDLDAFLWGDWQCDELGADERRTPADCGGREAPPPPFLSAEELAYARGRTDRSRSRSRSRARASSRTSGTPSAPRRPTRRSRSSSATWPRSCARRSDELAALGATYLQLDAPHYPLLVDPRATRPSTRAAAGPPSAGSSSGSSSTTT